MSYWDDLPAKLTIMSGGQTGVDRAALDWAIEHGINHWGWCSRGRLAEDGIISSVYNMKLGDSYGYEERTELNVKDSDATVIFCRNTSDLRGGTKTTVKFCTLHKRPVLVFVENDAFTPTVEKFRQMLEYIQVYNLNVAGPRESKQPGLSSYVRRILTETFFPTGSESATNP